MSFVGELWQVYVLFAVSGCFAVASTRLLISLVTANWFTAKRSLRHLHRTFGLGLWRRYSVSDRELAYRERWLAFRLPGARCRLHGGGMPITAYSFRTKAFQRSALSRSARIRAIRPSRTAGDKDEHTAPEVGVGWSVSEESRRFGCLSSPSSLWSR